MTGSGGYGGAVCVQLITTESCPGEISQAIPLYKPDSSDQLVTSGPSVYSFCEGATPLKTFLRRSSFSSGSLSSKCWVSTSMPRNVKHADGPLHL